MVSILSITKVLKMEKAQKVNRIVAFLSTDEQEQFLSDLLKAVEKAKEAEDFEVIDKCVEAWENVAELNSIPNFSDTVWNRFNNLKKMGRIN